MKAKLFPTILLHSRGRHMKSITEDGRERQCRPCRDGTVSIPVSPPSAHLCLSALYAHSLITHVLVDGLQPLFLRSVSICLTTVTARLSPQEG